MLLKNVIQGVSLLVIIFYLLSKRKHPEVHTENFVLEIIALISLIIAVITTLKLGEQSNQKFTNILNIVVGIPLIIYLALIFRQQVFVIDKINFCLIFVFIGLSMFQSVSLLLKRT